MGDGGDRHGDLREPAAALRLSRPSLVVAFTLVNLPSVSSWAGFGVALRGFLSDPVRLKWFNIAMGVLLAVTHLADAALKRLAAGSEEVEIRLLQHQPENERARQGKPGSRRGTRCGRGGNRLRQRRVSSRLLDGRGCGGGSGSKTTGSQNSPVTT